jgi:hypothetical protein
VKLVVDCIDLGEQEFDRRLPKPVLIGALGLVNDDAPGIRRDACERSIFRSMAI